MTRTKISLVSKKYLLPFVLVASLFFIWGFARSILDVLNKHFQETMHISMAQSAMIQATTYLGYFLMAIPAGLFITRFGFRKGVVTGLLLFAAGALGFIPCEASNSFAGFWVALFVVGCGLVFLETSANPYVTILGDPATSASRLNIAQSLNGLGCLLAPVLVAPVIFNTSGESSVALPYTIMGLAVLVISIIFSRVNLPEISVSNDATQSNLTGLQIVSKLLHNKHFMFGISALFFYEIAEITINSFFINYVTSDGWLTKSEAAAVLSFGGLGLFMLARVIGGLIMSRISAVKVLTFCAVCTVAGALAITLNLGLASKAGLFMCYAFEAIMFPTIFAITMRSVDASYTKMASSLLMMTPIGGAVGTILMGLVADNLSMSSAFIVPLIGYLFILAYSVKALKLNR